MNLKKRRFTAPGATTVSQKRQKVPVTGTAFVQGIDNITASTSPSVYTHVGLPMTYGPQVRLYVHDLHATFYAIDHNPATSTKAWTQGWMEMSGDTAYEKILPTNIGIDQATVESRVMKKLVLGNAYTPKTKHFPAITRKTGMSPATKNWGRPAVQSYLEDITARTSLNLLDVGSGMRALILASKLRMKNTGTTTDLGFKQKLRDTFPQLYTGSTNPVGGASHYSDLIDNELTVTPGVSATQSSLVTKVRNAHTEVNKETTDRFNYKWKEIKAGRMTTTQAGRWWENTFGVGGAVTGTGTKKSKHRKAYLKNKLARHGITYFK